MRKNFQPLFILTFILITLILTFSLLFEKQIFQKQAEEKEAFITFNPLSNKTLNRIWPFFSQGGEEKSEMLEPAKDEIKKLQPQVIRIDHLFDFSEVVKKDSSGKSIYDFSGPDKRIEEIREMGAAPFLSLSYFPPSFSNNITEFPPNLGGWQELVQKVIQRYSGKNDKNLLNVYYEVWNEPDLFGSMSAEKYFQLYRSSEIAANSCQNCNSFKIGGPAITTLKKDWMNRFLKSIKENGARLDFVSWHSYQISPQKTLTEAQTIKELTDRYGLNPELLITETGSVPEISPLHDNLFGASQAVNAVSVLKNSVDEIYSFELVDGADPQGKKFWGRWGLLTNKSVGISPKPRYYSFIYLNKLLDYDLPLTESSESVSGIGSTDGKNNYSFVVTKSTKGGPIPLLLRINDCPPGVYTTNVYNLDPLSQPLKPNTNQQTFPGGTLDIQTTAFPYSVFLIELQRISSATIKSLGRTELPEDSSARIGIGSPPLVYNLKQPEDNLKSTISFWFKPYWVDSTNVHTLIDFTKNGSGFRVWIGPSDFSIAVNLDTIANNVVTATTQMPLSSWKNVGWHKVNLVINRDLSAAGLMVDDQQSSIVIPPEQNLNNLERIYLGAMANKENSADGAIDDLEISINDKILYQENFN